MPCLHATTTKPKEYSGDGTMEQREQSEHLRKMKETLPCFSCGMEAQCDEDRQYCCLRDDHNQWTRKDTEQDLAL